MNLWINFLSRYSFTYNMALKYYSWKENLSPKQHFYYELFWFLLVSLVVFGGIFLLFVTINT